MAGISPDKVASGSWAAELFEAARSGKLSPQEAMAALSAYIFPSLDTTILAKGHLLHDLATAPDQWARLKAQPDLAPSAVIESVRRNSVLRWFSRVAAEDYKIDGLVIPKGARVMLLYGCANRDERRYEDPDRFDITRDARDQLSWGRRRAHVRGDAPGAAGDGGAAGSSSGGGCGIRGWRPGDGDQPRALRLH